MERDGGIAFSKEIRRKGLIFVLQQTFKDSASAQAGMRSKEPEKSGIGAFPRFGVQFLICGSVIAWYL